MLRNPYVAGVERFEAPLASGAQTAGSSQRKEQAALFCLLLWEHYQGVLRAMRYSINFDHAGDRMLEFDQQPPYNALIEFDASDASQIDIECISQQPAQTPRDLFPHARQQEDHYPVLIEVFIPLCPDAPQQGELSLQAPAADHLVVWCRSSLLSEIIALWERASALLLNRTT